MRKGCHFGRFLPYVVPAILTILCMWLLLWWVITTMVWGCLGNHPFGLIVDKNLILDPKIWCGDSNHASPIKLPNTYLLFANIGRLKCSIVIKVIISRLQLVISWFADISINFYPKELCNTFTTTSAVFKWTAVRIILKILIFYIENLNTCICIK